MFFLMTSLFSMLASTLTQSDSLSAIFPYLHFCLTAGQEHGNSSIHGMLYSLAFDV